MEETTKTRVSQIDWMFGIVIIMKKNVWDSNNYEAVAKKKNVWAKDKANNPIEQTVISQQYISVAQSHAQEADFGFHVLQVILVDGRSTVLFRCNVIHVAAFL